jgi:CheY-like chemotaxis protein
VQAIDYLKRQGPYTGVNDPLPSLVLIDLKLPLVDGLEVVEQLKSDPQLCSLPVVMLTSSGHEVDVNRAYTLGVNSYVCKPTDFEDYLNVIGAIGNYWFGVVEMPSGQNAIDTTRSH